MELIDTKKNTKEPITSATFLIVDDNDSNRNFLKQFLKRQSHQVLEASNGKIACNLLNKESSIEIVLLDMIMPEMNGFEVLSFMKNSPVFKDIPVIMISGLQESELVTKCIEAGADDYLSKPFEPKELDLRIKNIINKIKIDNLKRIIEFEKVKIDLNKQIIFQNNLEFKINNTEKIILEKMINNPGKVFAREEIGKLINIDKERSVDVIITRLRKKIEINPKNPKFLQTIRGAGYVLWIE